MKRFAKWCVCFSIVLMCSQSAWAADSTGATIDRRMLFNEWGFTAKDGAYYATNWTHVGPAPASFPSGMKWLLPGTNHVHSAGWKLTACRAGTSAKTSASALLIPPLLYGTSSTNWQASLQNTLDAKIETPFYTEGVGTIYFEAINVDPASPTEITVEIATNMIDHLYAGGPTNVMLTEETEQYTYNWLPLDVLTLNATSTNDLTRYQRLLNYRESTLVRIRRSGSVYTGQLSLDTMFTAVDNICISKPPSDVVIRRPEAVFQPGHPAAGTNLIIRCYVDNFSTNDYARTDHAKRTVTAYYRWRYLDQMSNSWSSLPMEYVAGTGDGLGNGERYQVGLPGQAEVGDLEYYFVCDFDGYRYLQTDYTKTGYTYITESLSPKTLRGGASEPDGREFYARLRRYSSRFGNMYLDRGTNEVPVEMTLAGDDEWVGMVPLGKGAVTNVAWRFKAVNTYVPDEDSFSTNPVYWAEQAQADVGTVPYGGMCVETDGATPIRVTVGEGGYLKVIFNTRTLEFVACRGEYQNFNAWPAPPATFTESGGQPSKQRFINTFDGWSTNVDTRHLEAIVGYPSATNVYWREPVTTLGDWVAGSAKYVSERFEADAVNKPEGTVRLRNLALRLKGGDGTLNLGYVYNHVATRPDGLKQISFKCRLGQPADPYDIAYNNAGFTKQNYLLRANVLGDTSVAPEAPSVSLIAYYTGPDNFYELRMTQIPYTGTTMSDDKSVRLQLFKWVNGVENPLGSPVTREARLRDRTLAELRIYNTSASSVDIKCKFGATDNVLTVTDSSSPHLKGTFGFLSADCQANFSAVYTQPTTTGAVQTGTATDELSASGSGFDALQPNWVVPYGRFVCTKAVAPYGIYSVTPNQNIGIYLQDSDRDDESEPGAPGTLDWKLMTQVAVPGFGYTLRTVPIYSWQSKFAMLQVMGGGADVIVDEMEVQSWRGQQTPDPDEDGDWLATEAWVVTNSAALGNVVQLDHTRANPDEAQAVRSMLLTNGMGMLEFDYKVLRPPAKLTVQYAFERQSGTWHDVQPLIVVSNVMSAYQHASVYFGTNAPGWLRVLNDRAGGYTNALVEINNVVAWDEPHIDSSSWKVYNAKISSTDTMRVILDESKACFLNNRVGPDAETDPVQDLYDPFLQSPVLPGGLGDLTFMARAYSNGQPATVYVYATTNNWYAPDDQWAEIYRFTNIVSTLYHPYSLHLLESGKRYKAIRLQTAIGEKRACLEEVSVSEPVFPGFDLVRVKALCRENGDDDYQQGRFQPMESDYIGVEAQISNIRLASSISDIHMYVTYYIGTNVWGVDNWPTEQTLTVPMYPTNTGSLVYRTLPSADIPPQERDQVVQYRVWADYNGGIPLRAEQRTFESPDWYFPVDLNQQYASQGWSPYAIVYGVWQGSVWINEVNSYEYVVSNGVKQSGFWDNRYIEIAVPAGVDLGGWIIDIVYDVPYKTVSFAIPAGKVKETAVVNGYAFFVIGSYPADNAAYPLPVLDYAYNGLSSVLPSFSPGGIRLRRPFGMYEHVIAYDWNPEWGDDYYYSGIRWAEQDPEGRFKYMGQEYKMGSLSVTNGTGKTAADWAFTGTLTNGWSFPQYWTPGAPNIGQVVPQAEELLPGVSNVLITSTLNIDKATQNDKRVIQYLLKIKKGTTTNIVYRTDDWYRLQSVTRDGSVTLATEWPSQVYTNWFESVQSNTTVDVEVGLRRDVSGLGVDGTVLNWLMSFGDGDLAPTYYYDRELTLTERYWLNANPTVTNILEGGIKKVVPDQYTNYYMTVWLALNGQNCTNLQGAAKFKVEAKEKLSDADWKMVMQYYLTTNSFDTNHTSQIFIANPFGYQLFGWSAANVFLHWVIEMEDPRVDSFEMINTTNTPSLLP